MAPFCNSVISKGPAKKIWMRKKSQLYVVYNNDTWPAKEHAMTSDLFLLGKSEKQSKLLFKPTTVLTKTKKQRD